MSIYVNAQTTDQFDSPWKSVVTLVIYGDQSKSWQPDTYSRELWRFKLNMEFPSIKLMDYNLDELEPIATPKPRDTT